jgi:multidrug efflux pump subunit AcrB
MAFYPVYAAQADAGEYARTLFTVVAISLLMSWLVALTMTPLNCISLLRAPKSGASEADPDPYAGGFFRFYRGALGGAIRWRVFTLAGVVVLLVAAVAGGFSRWLA